MEYIEDISRDQKVEVIQSSLDYLDRLQRNRFIIESHYLNQNMDTAQVELDNLMNGIVWLEYAVLLLKVKMDADEKNRLFEGVKEAVEVQDWFTIIDLITGPLNQYIEILRRDFLLELQQIQGEHL